MTMRICLILMVGSTKRLVYHFCWPLPVGHQPHSALTHIWHIIYGVWSLVCTLLRSRSKHYKQRTGIYVYTPFGMTTTTTNANNRPTYLKSVVVNGAPSQLNSAPSKQFALLYTWLDVMWGDVTWRGRGWLVGRFVAQPNQHTVFKLQSRGF